ncbi:endonuclease/exonuclease/phosphatase family protein [Pontibacter chitinilyticus]|uniref:endonuclease/exonuclease/phosphatase family protein n=1 Tax=Pontibacter chitinilyticus TaxID=2674989 RepID=UPI00321A7F33
MHHGIKTLFLLFTVIFLAGCAKLPVSSPKKGKPQTIAFYNTEKFFDTADDPATSDDAFTPAGEMEWTQEKYSRKVHNIASVLSTIGDGNGPAVIALAEVENKQVLQDLVNSPELRKSKYSFIHYDMADEQGLDIALLYKPKAFKPTAQQRIPISANGSNLQTRDILQVSGLLQGQPITLFVNHWPPRTRTRRGMQDDSHLRAAAATLRKKIDALQAADKKVRIVVMGDFDTEPRTDVLEKVLKASGRPNPYYDQELFNAFYLPYVNGLGTYFSHGDFKMLDQIMVSKSLIDGEGLEYIRGSAQIFDPERIKFLYGKYKNSPLSTFSGTTYFGGYSDHFPVYIQLRKVKER